MSKQITAFLDANVWFSAAHSLSGGSFLIAHLAKKKLIKVYANNHVLQEAERNLLLKSPDKLADYYLLLSEVAPVIVGNNVFGDIELQIKRAVPESDIPVLAGAVLSQADYLITLDKRDIANERVRKHLWPFRIVLPGEFLKILVRK